MWWWPVDAGTLRFTDSACDSVFVDTPDCVGLNVGTGAAVTVTNFEGFFDHIVWKAGTCGKA